MSRLPIRRADPYEPSPRQVDQAVRALRNTELAIFRHGLTARYQAEADRLDAQAGAEALQASLAEELNLLDYGLRRAGGSAAKAELVARKVELLSSINNRRINRRFGG
jgi:hypothetical protein